MPANALTNPTPEAITVSFSGLVKPKSVFEADLTILNLFQRGRSVCSAGMSIEYEIEFLETSEPDLKTRKARMARLLRRRAAALRLYFYINGKISTHIKGKAHA